MEKRRADQQQQPPTVAIDLGSPDVSFPPVRKDSEQRPQRSSHGQKGYGSNRQTTFANNANSILNNNPLSSKGFLGPEFSPEAEI